MDFIMSKTDRLLFILNLIRSRRNLKAKDLANECGVSERTIYRDLIAISSANIPIYFEKGYKFLTNAFLPPLNFSLDEYLVLHLGLNSEIINSNPTLKNSGKTALAKLESLLPEAFKNNYHKVKKKINIELSPKSKNSKYSLIFSLLKQGLLKEKRLKLKLCFGKSTSIVKEVFPEKLVYRNEEWLLIAEVKEKRKTISIKQIRGVSL